MKLFNNIHVFNALELLLLPPLMGYTMLLFADSFEEAWKTKSKKKKWIALSSVSFMIVLIFELA